MLTLLLSDEMRALHCLRRQNTLSSLDTYELKNSRRSDLFQLKYQKHNKLNKNKKKQTFAGW